MELYRDCLSVILVLLVQKIFTTECIQCYKCLFAPFVYFNNDTFLCQDFDYSEKFIVDCPYSTLCLKKNSHAKINGVQINGTERDCAAQKFDTQALKNGKWYAETRVEEPYTEGCNSFQDSFRTANVEHCYCRGNLCNTGHTVHRASDVFHYRTLIICVLGLLLKHNIGVGVLLL